MVITSQNHRFFPFAGFRGHDQRARRHLEQSGHLPLERVAGEHLVFVAQRDLLGSIPRLTVPGEGQRERAGSLQDPAVEKASVAGPDHKKAVVAFRTVLSRATGGSRSVP